MEQECRLIQTRQIGRVHIRASSNACGASFCIFIVKHDGRMEEVRFDRNKNAQKNRGETCMTRRISP